jgi:hypothetical protein
MLKKILISVSVVFMIAYAFSAISCSETQKSKNSYEGYSKATKPKGKIA